MRRREFIAALGGAAAQLRSLFQLMGRSVGYWYRRGRGVPVGEGRVSFCQVASVAKCLILLFRRDSDTR